MKHAHHWFISPSGAGTCQICRTKRDFNPIIRKAFQLDTPLPNKHNRIYKERAEFYLQSGLKLEELTRDLALDIDTRI